MPNSKVLGVLGGLGPMATVYFYELITAHTKAARDQDHIDILLSSRASTPDRTAFILGTSTEDPFAVMEAEAFRLAHCGAQVLAIPCNTAHYFYDRLRAGLPVPVLNMVEDTVDKAQQMGCRKVGILATDGTIRTDTYQAVCRAKDMPCAVPGPEAQQAVMRLIYEDIKRGRAPDMALFRTVADELFQDGCDVLILACTELSLLQKAGLLDGRYLDSMAVLAEAAILACGKTPVGFPWQQDNV